LITIFFRHFLRRFFFTLQIIIISGRQQLPPCRAAFAISFATPRAAAAFSFSVDGMLRCFRRLRRQRYHAPRRHAFADNRQASIYFFFIFHAAEIFVLYC
jgi:hypothetical protein